MTPRPARFGPPLLALLLAVPAVQAQSTASTASSDASRGRELAATCANCHGTGGRARGEMRPLAGMPPQAMLAMLDAYRKGTLPATIMHQIAKGYTEEQLGLVAAWFGSQPAATR
ncbi:c-type cytochrome [Piscinibacter sakaiensis]|uniref:Cytochrome c subunit of flavocytochrome c sulfide dehydrogenase n=2 Tax=Piscinibacter sakaiensis TaxID=1547922 RepID=A0A0K8P7Y1_PISS1|nr:c-type cytochrome [Piscinibacter sakaiensis]GAP38736.1 cytochrome c subunit of flavocytochrome c sulfide dehydrogenase [Piscinibacter sakaiensis]